MACTSIRALRARRSQKNTLKQACVKEQMRQTCERLTAGMSPAAAAAAAGPSASIAIRDGPASFDFFPPFFFGLRMATVLLLRLLPLLRTAVGPSAAAGLLCCCCFSCFCKSNCVSGDCAKSQMNQAKIKGFQGRKLFSYASTSQSSLLAAPKQRSVRAARPQQTSGKLGNMDSNQTA